MKTKKQLLQEIDTWDYLKNTLTQPHQRNVKTEIRIKIDNLKAELKLRTESEALNK